MADTHRKFCSHGLNSAQGDVNFGVLGSLVYRQQAEDNWKILSVKIFEVTKK